MPPTLEEGIVYISIKYGIISHKCCCGCGNEVVTNLSPNGWSLIYDGQTVTLHPSIGNWNFKCRSHYWIRKDRVEWAEDWETYQQRQNAEAQTPRRSQSERRQRGLTAFIRKLRGK
jgi:hypothetical protein